MTRHLPLCLVLASLALLPGCIAVGGTSTNNRPTTGQELIDLKSALERGAISQAEYDQQKTRVLTGK